MQKEGLSKVEMVGKIQEECQFLCYVFGVYVRVKKK